MNLQVRQRSSLQGVTFLGGLALFGGDCFNLALTKVFWTSVWKKWGIFECFLTAFCGGKDRIVLFYDTVKVWKTRVISGNEDRSVSISCFRFVIIVVIIVRLVTGIQTFRSRGKSKSSVRIRKKTCNDYCCKKYEAEKHTEHNIECLVIYSRENL